MEHGRERLSLWIRLLSCLGKKPFPILVATSKVLKERCIGLILAMQVNKDLDEIFYQFDSIESTEPTYTSGLVDSLTLSVRYSLFSHSCMPKPTF